MRESRCLGAMMQQKLLKISYRDRIIKQEVLSGMHTELERYDETKRKCAEHVLRGSAG